MVRWEGFDAATHDSWILRKHVNLEAIIAYEQLLTDEAALETSTKPGKKPAKDKLDTFIGKQGQFSALAQRARQQVQQQRSRLRRAQQAVAHEAADHDTNSEVSPVSALSGRRRNVPTRFKPT